MKARLYFRMKLTYLDGGFAELVAWKIPVGPRYPDGIRYRFAFIPAESDRPAVLYDNHHPKGHHKHVDEIESKSSFSGVGRLVEEFRTEIESWKKRTR